MKTFKEFIQEAVPTNSTGSGVAEYSPYLFPNEDDDDLSQDYDQMVHASKEYTQLMDKNTINRIRDNIKKFQTEKI